MDNRKIREKTAKEIEKRVSAVSNLKKDIYGVRSDLLDILLLKGKKEDRKKYWEILKTEFERKIALARKHAPPRARYINNMERIIKDIEKRISGEKTNDKRNELLNLNKRWFRSEVMKEIADEMIQEAATNKQTNKSDIYKNLRKKEKYAKDMERFLSHRSTEIEDEFHKKNVEKLINGMKEKEVETKSPRTKKLIMAFGILIGIWLTTRWWRELSQEIKNKDLVNIGQEKNKEKKNITEKNKEREMLQAEINDTLLQKGIQYEDVINAINELTNKESKNEIISYINAGDIIWLQEYLGMKKNSPYALNKVSGVIDDNTINILKWGRFGMTDKEILENENISQDVKDAYKAFMEGTMNNNNENYLIESKICMHSFLFDKQHRLIDLQPIIVGRDIGKDQEYVPFEWFYENGKRKYYKDIDPKELNRNTPEWLYAIEGIDQLEEDDYMIDGPKEAIILNPIMLTTKGLTYDQKRIKMRDHPLFIAEWLWYVQALETPETTDNNKSKWCINRKNFWRVKENLKTDPNGSRVYITQYTKYKNMQQQRDQICINDKKNYFPPIRRK